jgi:ribosomal 50S subunit-recycling heat shock protein
LEISLGQRTVKVEVTSVQEHVRKEDAPALYREIV